MRSNHGVTLAITSHRRNRISGLRDGFPGRFVVRDGGSPRRYPGGWAGSAPTRRVWPVMDDIERGAIPAEGLDPNNSAAVAALELVGLELGRADPNLRRQRAGPTLCTPNRVRSGSD